MCFAREAGNCHPEGAKNTKDEVARKAARRWTRTVWVKAPQKNLCGLDRSSGLSTAATRQTPPRGSLPVPLERENAVVLVRTVASRQIVVALNDVAKSHGIRAGMTFSQARALYADVVQSDHDPVRDATALEALARWMMRFSPIVALPERSKNSSITEDSSLFLDITGCEKVFRGFEGLLRQVEQALEGLRITHSCAIAPTPGAAWALTHSRHRIATLEQLPEALDGLHPSVLRVDRDIVESLVHVGLNTIGLIRKLPRQSLPSRFGPMLLSRLDQAFGLAAEVLVPVEPVAPIREKIEFEAAIDNPEVIDEARRILSHRVMSELARRGRGARVVEIEYFLPSGEPVRQTIRLSRASCDVRKLMNLLRCSNEQAVSCATGRPGRGRDALAIEYVPPDGFLGVGLTVVSSEKITDEQISLQGGDQFEAEREVESLVERLCARMGDQAVEKIQLVESHVPERAWKPEGSCVARSAGARSGAGNPLAGSRPLQLLPVPESAGVIVSPSHDLEGLPVSFTWNQQVHGLKHVIGPERIAGRWWEGHDRTRDYFDVENDRGERFWIFRVLETRRWYVHGQF